MALTGIDPNDPTPGDRRELILGAGSSGTVGSSRDVIIFATKTSAGSEVVETLGPAVGSSEECISRYGRRSEAYAMYKKYIAVDPGATLYIYPVTAAGSASTCTFTFADGAATDTTTLYVEWAGETIGVTIASGDTAITQAAAFAAAVNAASGGEWMFTASVGGGGSEHIVTCTTASILTGPRSSYVLTRLRATYAKSVTTTCTKSAVTAGTTEDDGTTAFATAAKSNYYYWVLPWHATSAPTTTDNQIGEAIQNVITQNLPSNGKEQMVCVGLVGTQAQATTVATASACNSTRAAFFHAENSDWLPSMLAAHCAAVKRSQEIAHPSANLAGYGPTDNTIFQVPAPYVIGDRPTATEIKADLNNGVSPIAFTPRGSPYIVRQITSRSLNAQGSNDYRAREGHIPSAIDFAWQTFKQRYANTKQPFAANDPAEGKVPTARTTTPSAIKALMRSVIDDLTASKPLGIYDGPILAPDKIDQMKKSIAVTKVTAGFSIAVDLFAVEHNLKSETTIREVGAAY